MESLILATYVMKTNSDLAQRRGGDDRFYETYGRTRRGWRPLASAVATAGRWFRR